MLKQEQREIIQKTNHTSFKASGHF